MIMKIIAVIPAHMASVRFPKKILFSFHGLPMIEHVRRRALLSKGLSNVVVATCDEEIASTIRGYGGDVVMTANTHKTGTSRVAEAIDQLDCTHVILLQGDEPLLLPRHIESMVNAIALDPNGDAWNATGPIQNEVELDRHSFVKCVTSKNGRIMHCFRRTPAFSDLSKQQLFVRKILGIIGYRKEFLLKLTEVPASPIEIAESIEQMRILENDWALQSVPVAPSLPSVNEPHEADIVLEYIKLNLEQRELLAFII
ncbi:3-deoxy-manno-octulosonate cytidylyltransferase [Alphaproteobacteria bacterium]|nr:3-deoxy-manno-octulosonate cytidylyltransferase [Alphaproteobacteria bacterium]